MQTSRIGQRALKFLAWIAAGFTGASLAYTVLVLLPVSRYPTAESIWIQGTYNIIERAASRKTPHVLLLGGWNVHFGLQAKVISEVTGLPTVNFGTHAGLGLDYLLYRATPFIGRGDIVVLVPEYPLYKTSSTIDQALGSFLKTSDRRYITGLSLREQLEVAAQVSLKLKFLLDKRINH